MDSVVHDLQRGAPPLALQHEIAARLGRVAALLTAKAAPSRGLVQCACKYVPLCGPDNKCRRVADIRVRQTGSSASAPSHDNCSRLSSLLRLVLQPYLLALAFTWSRLTAGLGGQPDRQWARRLPIVQSPDLRPGLGCCGRAAADNVGLWHQIPPALDAPPGGEGWAGRAPDPAVLAMHQAVLEATAVHTGSTVFPAALLPHGCLLWRCVLWNHCCFTANGFSG